MLLRFLRNRRAEKQRIEAVTLIKEGIEFLSLTGNLMRGPMELKGEFFRQSIRGWIVAIEKERAALLNRPLPNEALAQNCDMVDTILRSTHGLTESEAKSVIRNLAKDLAESGQILEEELERNYPWAA